MKSIHNLKLVFQIILDSLDRLEEPKIEANLVVVGLLLVGDLDHLVGDLLPHQGHRHKVLEFALELIICHKFVMR